MDKLIDLANSGKSFWKFTQSQMGKSVEKVYAHYVEGSITVAEDLEHGLFFTESSFVSNFIMYGDILTKLCMDVNNPKFIKIAHNEVRHYTNGFYETKEILVEKNYSLAHKEGIRMLFEITPFQDFKFLFLDTTFSPSIKNKLNLLKYTEAEELVEELEKYKDISKEAVMSYIDKYRFF